MWYNTDIRKTGQERLRNRTAAGGLTGCRGGTLFFVSVTLLYVRQYRKQLSLEYETAGGKDRILRKIGMNLGAYPEMDRKEDIAYLKWAGFDATFVYYFHREDAKLIRQTAEWLDRAGITLDTIHAPFWGVNDLWRDGETAEKYFAELQDSILLASECRVPTVVMHLSSGDRPPNLNEKGFSRIDLLVQSARDKGIRVAFENQRKIANLAYVMERYEDDPAVGFCWDVGHEKCLSGGWEYMPMFGDRLAALHIHDNPCRHNEDLHMIPGDGKIDYRRMAELIRESGYTGTLMLELMEKPSGKYDNLTPEEYYSRAYAAAVRLWTLTDGERESGRPSPDLPET